MTKPRNGYVPDAELTTFEGFPGARDTAALLERIHADSGGKVTLAKGAPFYRSFFVQGDMHVHPGLYNLDSASSVTLAQAGSSSHGYGDRFDVSTNDGGRDWMIEHGPAYGCVREFGAADPGHWLNPHETWPGSAGGATPVSSLTTDQVKAVAAYLNSRAHEVGKPTTTATEDGKQGDHYWTLVQALGAADGIYPQPAYLIDGKPGNKTLSVEAHYAQIVVGAGGPVIVTPAPAPGETDSNMVRRIARYLNGRVLGIDSTAVNDGQRGSAYWTEVQRAGRIDGLYPKSYVIDGKPGPKSIQLEAHYSQIAPH